MRVGFEPLEHMYPFLVEITFVRQPGSQHERLPYCASRSLARSVLFEAGERWFSEIARCSGQRRDRVSRVR
jgi:hypothetical protein